ncbi:MAG: hypothetical protein FWH33_06255 [Oscillospiraceae bacterium]|nr:hypothetical protein [Oscillospiraceae bacterium]
MSKTPSIIGMAIGAVMVVLVIFVALAADIFTPYDPIAMSIEDALAVPSIEHPYGTDRMGRDVHSRVLHGIGATLGVSALAVLFALVIGSLLGAIGLLGESADRIIAGVSRFLGAGPGVLLAFAIVYSAGASGYSSVGGIAVVLLPGFMRAFRGAMVYFRRNNPLKALMVFVARCALAMALAAFLYAVMGFIGFGAQPPISELGAMIGDGRMFLRNAYYLVSVPAFALAVVVLSFCVLGESMNAALLAGEARGA